MSNLPCSRIDRVSCMYIPMLQPTLCLSLPQLGYLLLNNVGGVLAAAGAMYLFKAKPLALMDAKSLAKATAKISSSGGPKNGAGGWVPPEVTITPLCTSDNLLYPFHVPAIYLYIYIYINCVGWNGLAVGVDSSSPCLWILSRGPYSLLLYNLSLF